MTAWPGNPFASMDVDNHSSGTESEITLLPQTQQVVTDVNIDFRMDIAFHDHPYFDHGRGYFSARLDKLTVNGFQQVDFQSKTLGNNNDDGDWYDSLTVSVSMTDVIEQYRIVLHCETQATSLGTSADITGYAQAIQGESAIGTFTLDFVPLSIVYCPPGQDMTASLTQSSSYGTRFTIGDSSSMQSQTGVQAKVDFLGLVGESVGFSQSQTVANQTTSGIQVSHFRNTIVTADNQKAIGRAYWGPLGDIFVILVNPTFAASKRADGTILYALTGIEQVLTIPARRLLRPDGDPIAGVLPADTRRQLLQLDPFITNLDLFFPDSGADLTNASIPFADPSANNRAELIGRWWLDSGTELNYAIGESHQLFSANATEVQYSSTVSISANAGVDIDGLTAALGVSQSNTTTVGLQSSKETDASYSTTASCFLIHSQNERDLAGIEIYYDKIFSTFMFRRLSLGRPPAGGVCGGAIAGHVGDVEGLPLRKLAVSLTDAEGNVHETTTSITGQYGFANLCPGAYTLVAGDQRLRIELAEEASPVAPARRDVVNVRRVIDITKAPIWELREALELSSDQVRRIGAGRQYPRNLTELAKLVGADAAQRADWTKRNVLVWPRPATSRARRPAAGGRPESN
jgi:hypothetical protein